MPKLIKRKQIDLKLGEAPDGTYGFNSNIPNVNSGDNLESAIDKIITVLDKLAPSKPPFLNDSLMTLLVNSTATLGAGYLTIDGTSVNNIYKMSNGTTITWSTNNGTQTAENRSGYFRDGESTTAKLRIRHVYNGVTRIVEIGDFNLLDINESDSNSDSTNYNLSISIDDKKDYYSDDSASATKSNFYLALKASMSSTMVSSTNDADTLERNVYLEYSELGDFTDTLTLSSKYRIESSDTPSTSTPVLSFPTMTGFVSGVPTLLASDPINITATISNGIKNYYPLIIGTSTITATTSQNNTLSGALTPESNHTYSVNHAILPNQYTETFVGSVTPYDIFGNGSSVNSATNTNNRVDTTSITRLTAHATSRRLSPSSSTPDFEAISNLYYDTTAHTNSLNATSGVYSNALQLLNGMYQYPASVNYVSYGGPNYTTSNFPTGQYRWLDISLTSITNASAITLNISGASGFSSILQTGLKLYVRVDGAIPTGGDGWLDANSAYPGVGNPTGANGSRSALVVGSSTSTTKRITFGTSVKTGTVSVRIGFLKGSNLKFTGFTIS